MRQSSLAAFGIKSKNKGETQKQSQEGAADTASQKQKQPVTPTKSAKKPPQKSASKRDAQSPKLKESNMVPSKKVVEVKPEPKPVTKADSKLSQNSI